MTENIAVIVVNYGTADLAIAAVESVLDRQHGGRAVEVHLVDNASPSGDAARLEAAHNKKHWGSDVTLWLEPENHGFGRGNNRVLHALAARPAAPEFVFLLNPDARLANEALDVLTDLLAANPRAAAAGAGVLRPDGSATTAAFRFPGALSEIARVVSFGPLDRLLRSRRVPLPPDHPAGPVDWVSGAGVMFRFAAIAELDFFDPGFFLYYEEVDLMRRLRAAGWQILYQPQAKVIHVEGAATGQFAGRVGRKADPAYLYQSWRHYFTRAYGRLGALAIAMTHWPAAALNVVHRRLRGKTPTIPSRFFRDHWRHVLWPLLTGGRS